MTDETALLQTFVSEHSDAAFRALVERRIDFVYAAALRQVGGDAHLAEEVTQDVFLDLARKARGLAGRSDLAGWLHTSTRFAAAKLRRTHGRRRNYETRAHAMSEILSAPSATEVKWNELRPVIDDALGELGAPDRHAILLRFFEGRSHADVGAAIGLGENSARMRVDRALEKLRERLARRGITSTASAIGVALASQPALAAPAGLAASVTGAALAGAAGAAGLSGTLSLVNFMSSTKLVVGTVGAIAAVGLGAWLSVPHGSTAPVEPSLARTATEAEIAALRDENRRLRAELSRRSAEAGGAGSRENPAPAAAGRTAGNPTVDTLRVLIDLRRRKLAQLEYEFVSEDSKLLPAFVELFALSPTEMATLQQAIDAARERVAVLIRENTSIGRAQNGDVLFAVKPFPEAGGTAYDAMLKSFADTLGAERYNAFLALGAEQAEKLFGRFGTSERSISLSREGSGSELRYRINDRTRNGPHNNSNYVSDRLTPDRFLREIGPLADLLPGDFAPPR